MSRRRANVSMLVVGDIMCDHYVWGDVERISPEAPVPVVRVRDRKLALGGAANVAMNLAALGCRVHLVGLVGNDDAGRWLVDTLRARSIDTRGVVRSSARPTTLKTRIMARGQHLLRIDREAQQTASIEDQRRLVAAVGRVKRTVAGIVCSDYGKGVLSARVLDAVLAGRRRPYVLVDPKGRDFGKYSRADLLTPNEKELLEATADGRAADRHDRDAIPERAEQLMRRLRLRALLVTRGARGMDLFERGKRRIDRTHVPVSQRHEVFDVTGAGDTVAAVMAFSVARGMALPDAARTANAAAGIVVGMVGTAVAEADTLARMIDGEASQARAKVLSAQALAARVADARSQGASIVFTNGFFDVLDVGHLHLLQRARALGEVLVVAVNDDASTTALKGRRPVVPAVQRAEILAALRFVDYVTVFSEPTPLRLIRTLRPEVLVKGGNYTLDQVVGREHVERYGGRVVVIPRLR